MCLAPHMASLTTPVKDSDLPAPKAIAAATRTTATEPNILIFIVNFLQVGISPRSPPSFADSAVKAYLILAFRESWRTPRSKAVLILALRHKVQGNRNGFAVAIHGLLRHNIQRHAQPYIPIHGFKESRQIAVIERVAGLHLPLRFHLLRNLRI